MRKVGSTTDTADANGEYTNGNVAQGIPPTIINAEMLNTFQRELIGVVEGAGMELNSADDNQVVKAIDKKVGGGRLLNIKTFTSSGTYTPTPGTKYVIIEAVGGGGGGGGCSSTSSDNAAVSGGGASGSYIRGKFDISNIGNSVAINIGAGGAGGIGGNSGSAGGNTTFGLLATAPGGLGGTSSTNPSSSAFIAVGGAPGAIPTGGSLISSRGNRGGSGLFFNSSTGAVGGDGSPSQLGGGGVGSGSSGSTGTAGSGYGSGGGGNARQPSSSANNGYSGAPGVLIICEYS
ncbi:MAG: phage tail protein [Serratia marcescens]|nr:phage tail protein [Serratia marcescens]